MKILIACNHYPVASGRYVADAFRRLGHEVKTLGYSTQNNVWGMKVESKYAWYPDPTPDGDWPDLIIVMDTDSRVWDQVKHFQYHNKINSPVVIYTVDNHVRDVEDDLFNHYFLAHYHGPVYPVDPARKDHSWLPCASDPMFTPSPIPWNERAYDVACVGVLYPRRVEVINALKEAGLSVFVSTGLLYEEYRAAYWNARISLCVSAAGDVAQRIFETGRMGCAVMTDPLLDIADPKTCAALKLNGRIEYTNPKEAVAVARDLLGGIGERFIIGGALEQRPELVLGQQAAALMAESCKPHTWDARAQVIVDWYEREYGKDKQVAEYAKGVTTDLVSDGNYPEAITIAQPTHKPFLNLGCGRTHFPSEPPLGHEMVDPEIYRTGEWLNVDKVEGVGADIVFDLFAYPWPLEDNSFDGAVLGHIVEHIPHEIKLHAEYNQKPYSQWTDNEKNLSQMQDGWFTFFAELYRVLTPGAIVHIISPYGWSDGAITDPTHTRYLTINTFHHGLSEAQYTNTFKYNIGCNFEVDGDPTYRFTPMAKPFMGDRDTMENAIQTRLNMVYDFYIRLKAVK